jgi:CelD/BcsL family acetyltransferase involved in cellulose biosynthesis
MLEMETDAVLAGPGLKRPESRIASSRLFRELRPAGHPLASFVSGLRVGIAFSMTANGSTTAFAFESWYKSKAPDIERGRMSIRRKPD